MRRLIPCFAFLILHSAFLPIYAFDWNSIDLDKVASGSTKLLKAAVGMSDDQEIKLGREVAANLAARYGLDEDPTVEHYVNLVGQTVVQKCSRLNIPYHFGILKTKEVNALAAPGGYIFITDGLLHTLETEGELAGVLAHEVCHVTQRHIVKAIRKANLVGAGSDFAAAADKHGEQYTQLTDFSVNLLSNGLSRQDELEADQLGTALAAKAGYNPHGLRDSIARLGKAQTNPGMLAQFNKTHPPTADRLRAIDHTLATAHLGTDGANLPERFAKNIPKT